MATSNSTYPVEPEHDLPDLKYVKTAIKPENSPQEQKNAMVFADQWPQSKPSSSEDNISAPQKRSHAHFSANEKMMITNVYKYVVKEKVAECPYEDPHINECLTKTAEIIGIPSKTVYRVLKDYREKKMFTPPKKPGPRGDFRSKLDEKTSSAIKRKVYDLNAANVEPTIKKVAQAVNDDPDLPNFSITTMGKILKYLNLMNSKITKTCPK